MLPKFPQFKKLELTDQVDIEHITSNYQPYSDFVFANMWAWDIGGESKISVLNGNLVIILKDLITNNLVCSYLGNNIINETLDSIFDFLESSENSEVSGTGLIPEVSLLGINLSKYMIEIDPNTSDYIYELTDLVAYQGSKYASKRNLLNSFVSKNKNHSIEIMDLKDEENKDKIMELNHKWAHNKNIADSEHYLTKEIPALDRLLKSGTNDLLCIGAYVEGILVGFSVLSLSADNYAIGLFSKFDSLFTGLNEYMMSKNASLLIDKGYKYLNAEEDLGISGLRFSKNSFRPTGFLRKYFIKKL